ncbi:MAG: hypothetical protein Q9219_000777 [cf. Caloplaca sp. 3 TL-2023]
MDEVSIINTPPVPLPSTIPIGAAEWNLSAKKFRRSAGRKHTRGILQHIIAPQNPADQPNSQTMTNFGAISSLHRADGSASFSCNGYSILAAINGPIEVQRKDEIPEEAAIDVVVRPASGVGGVRERHLESIVEKTLRQVILVSAHPRTLIQVTLQVIAAPAEHSGSDGPHQSASNLALLPALLRSSMLALLSTSLPLTMILTSQLVAVSSSGELLGDPQTDAIKKATSLHVFGFSSHGNLIVSESEGSFNMDTWDHVYDKAERACRGSSFTNVDHMGDVDMESSQSDNLERSLKQMLEQKIAKEQRWKEM